MIDVAIVGLGSWGLCVLERVVNRARTTQIPIRVHVIEPGQPGGGVYDVNQRDYLVLNNPCGQLSLYAAPSGGEEPPYAMGLYEWATRRGYRWVGNDCRVDPAGRPLDPTDFLPRRLMGEYLSWFYGVLVAHAPLNVEVVHHRANATDIAARLGGREEVFLDNGESVAVDHVVLTSGHTYNVEPERAAPAVRFARPYPVEFFDDRAAPGEAIAIAGMGLVAFDILAALTVGRGGGFELTGDRMKYRASGREPAILLYSRTGMPYCAKPASVSDATGDYQPVICTSERIEGIRQRKTATDFRADVLPLILAEMQARYYTQAAHIADGASAAERTRSALGRAWREGSFGPALANLEPGGAIFDPAEHVFAGLNNEFLSAKDYEQHVYDLVSSDLDEALAGSAGSPVKAALEVTRILRDSVRSVVEFGGLSLESYLDFLANIRPRINHLEAGPPLMRSQQLLALLDAGVVQIPFGPSPVLAPRLDGQVRVRSTQLLRPHAATATSVVRGHLELPSLVQSASPLLTRMYKQGRLQQLRYGDTSVGSIAISEEFHPFDVEGRLQENISVLGVLTEGVRYFTHYLPSPKSRLRAVLDAQACVEAIVG